MQVKAAVHYQPGQGVEIDVLDVDEPRAHEVRVHDVAGGIQQTMEHAFHSIHRGPTAVMIGVPPAGMRLSVDPSMLLQGRILTGTSFGSTCQRVDLPMIVDMFMVGKYKLRELNSREVELEDPNDAYDRLIKGEVKPSVVRFS